MFVFSLLASQRKQWVTCTVIQLEIVLRPAISVMYRAYSFACISLGNAPTGQQKLCHTSVEGLTVHLLRPGQKIEHVINPCRLKFKAVQIMLLIPELWLQGPGARTLLRKCTAVTNGASGQLLHKVNRTCICSINCLIHVFSKYYSGCFKDH